MQPRHSRRLLRLSRCLERFELGPLHRHSSLLPHLHLGFPHPLRLLPCLLLRRRLHRGLLFGLFSLGCSSLALEEVKHLGLLGGSSLLSHLASVVAPLREHVATHDVVERLEGVDLALGAHDHQRERLRSPYAFHIRAAAREGQLAPVTAPRALREAERSAAGRVGGARASGGGGTYGGVSSDGWPVLRAILLVLLKLLPRTDGRVGRDGGALRRCE